MWFRRMVLEEWFDEYQYAVDYDIGESAVKYLTMEEVGVDLGNLPLRYGHHMGRPDLREVIAQQYPGLSGEQILVTQGCSEAIFIVMMALLKPGDQVVVEQPNYPSLYEIPRGLNCDVVEWELRHDQQFRPSPEELPQLVTPETKLVVLTHPNNPTGSMITQDEMNAIVEFVESNGLYLVFDETYRELDFTGSLAPAATLSPRVVSVSSMSKCYGLPGIRTGWVATQDSALIDRILAVREQVTITNNAISEEIAFQVLQSKEEFLEKAREHVARNRELVVSWMASNTLVEWVCPEAGVVCLPRLRESIQMDPERLYRRLAERYRTFVVPGRCFEMDNRYFRLGFGAHTEEIRIGLNNLQKALDDLRS